MEYKIERIKENSMLRYRRTLKEYFKRGKGEERIGYKIERSDKL